MECLVDLCGKLFELVLCVVELSVEEVAVELEDLHAPLALRQMAGDEVRRHDAVDQEHVVAPAQALECDRILEQRIEVRGEHDLEVPGANQLGQALVSGGRGDSLDQLAQDCEALVRAAPLQVLMECLGIVLADDALDDGAIEACT